MNEVAYVTVSVVLEMTFIFDYFDVLVEKEQFNSFALDRNGDGDSDYLLLVVLKVITIKILCILQNILMI